MYTIKSTVRRTVMVCYAREATNVAWAESVERKGKMLTPYTQSADRYI